MSKRKSGTRGEPPFGQSEQGSKTRDDEVNSEDAEFLVGFYREVWAEYDALRKSIAREKCLARELIKEVDMKDAQDFSLGFSPEVRAQCEALQRSNVRDELPEREPVKDADMEDALELSLGFSLTVWAAYEALQTSKTEYKLAERDCVKEVDMEDALEVSLGFCPAAWAEYEALQKSRTGDKFPETAEREPVKEVDMLDALEVSRAFSPAGLAEYGSCHGSNTIDELPEREHGQAGDVLLPPRYQGMSSNTPIMWQLQWPQASGGSDEASHMDLVMKIQDRYEPVTCLDASCSSRLEIHGDEGSAYGREEMKDSMPSSISIGACSSNLQREVTEMNSKDLFDIHPSRAQEGSLLHALYLQLLAAGDHGMESTILFNSLAMQPGSVKYPSNWKAHVWGHLKRNRHFFNVNDIHYLRCNDDQLDGRQLWPRRSGRIRAARTNHPPASPTSRAVRRFKPMEIERRPWQELAIRAGRNERDALEATPFRSIPC